MNSYNMQTSENVSEIISAHITSQNHTRECSQIITDKYSKGSVGKNVSVAQWSFKFLKNHLLQ